MNVYFITFRSVTLAQRGERLLTEEGIQCTLQRTPRWMETQGCGYALRVRTVALTRILQILKQNRITLRRVYLQREDGALEEVTL